MFDGTNYWFGLTLSPGTFTIDTYLCSRYRWAVSLALCIVLWLIHTCALVTGELCLLLCVSCYDWYIPVISLQVSCVSCSVYRVMIDTYLCSRYRWAESLALCMVLLLIHTCALVTGELCLLLCVSCYDWHIPVLSLQVSCVSCSVYRVMIDTYPCSRYMWAVSLALCIVLWLIHTCALVTGELCLLLWGIRLCIVVRKAPSEFNESRFISWAIYNETLLSLFLNIVMWVHALYIVIREVKISLRQRQRVRERNFCELTSSFLVFFLG